MSPTAVRGAFGSLTQIATCFGLMGALFIGFPSKEIVGWYGILNGLSEAGVRACVWRV